MLSCSGNVKGHHKLKRICQVKPTPDKLNDVWSISASAPFMNSSFIGSKKVDCDLGAKETFTCQSLLAEDCPEVPIKTDTFKNTLMESEIYATSMWRQGIRAVLHRLHNKWLLFRFGSKIYAKSAKAS